MVGIAGNARLTILFVFVYLAISTGATEPTRPVPLALGDSHNETSDVLPEREAVLRALDDFVKLKCWCFPDQPLESLLAQHGLPEFAQNTVAGEGCIKGEYGSDLLDSKRYLVNPVSVTVRGEEAGADAIEETIARTFSLPQPHAFHAWVTRFDEGHFAAETTDCFLSKDDANKAEGESDPQQQRDEQFAANERMASVLVFLNDQDSAISFQGGEVEFTDIALEVRPERGAALVWYSLDSDGRCNAASSYAHLPVTGGQAKFVLQKLYHAKPIVPPIVMEQVLCTPPRNNSRQQEQQTNTGNAATQRDCQEIVVSSLVRRTSLLFDDAMAMMQQGPHSMMKAKPLFEQAVAEWPDFGLANLFVGITTQHARGPGGSSPSPSSTAAADAYFERALDLTHGAAADAHLFLGSSAATKGSVDEAERHWLEGWKLMPFDDRMLVDLARLMYDNKRYAEAARYFRRALALNSDENSPAHHMLQQAKRKLTGTADDSKERTSAKGKPARKPTKPASSRVKVDQSKDEL